MTFDVIHHFHPRLSVTCQETILSHCELSFTVLPVNLPNLQLKLVFPL